MTFNPLDHPVSFTYPMRTAQSAWTQHIPLAMLLVDLLRPSVFVELGTHYGTSYCAFCQAVKELKLDCRCYAVDTWEGDDQAGHYGVEVLNDLRGHHDTHYASFSQLLQCRFDEACPRFADHSIDLLHIDGYHTYEAASHDFGLWLPKMSDRGVIVFHDIAEHHDDFGVWKLWSELEARYSSSIAFYHGHGLGIVAVGEHVPDAIRELLELSGPQRAAMRVLMGELGLRIDEREEARRLRDANAHLNNQIAILDETVRQTANTEEVIATYRRELADAQMQLSLLSATSRVSGEEQDSLLRQRQSELDEARDQATILEARLSQAQWQINWFESSRGVRLVKLARASRAVLQHKGPIALVKHVALWTVGRRGYHLRDIQTPQPVLPALRATSREPKRGAIMFISGVPNAAMRYRCTHVSEALGFVGYASDEGIYGEVDLGDIVHRYAAFVLHRVPYNPDVESFIDEAQIRGKPVFFDTDDWVFDLEVPQYVPAYDDLAKDVQRLYVNGLQLYRRTLMACDGAIVSTESLRQLALRYNENVVVAPNMVSQAMIDGADTALNWAATVRGASPRDTVVIGYFSGTATHNRDFLMAADAIVRALQDYPQVTFKVVGELKLDDRFKQFGQRVVQFGLQQWEDLPRMYTTLDISIAPLEPDNPYTDAKSCIKYLEAAICEVPTVASPRTDFQRTIVHGENGFLAETPDEWYAALAQLIESTELRREMGLRASESVRANETTLTRSGRVHDSLRSLIPDFTDARSYRPLTINWILHAPIAERGGGYRTIFRLVNHLGKQGHLVRVYIDPTAHLAQMSPDQIRDYVTKYFGALNAEIIVGHEHIQPADASIATFWPTAYTVARHQQSLHKFYFVQDFEPEFYDLADHHYVEAEKSYSLPLQPICIGKHLGQRIAAFSQRTPEVVDFAIDQTVFHMRRSPEDRNGPPKVLFFARPGLKRRGFEMGIQALRKIKAQRPDVEIMLFGATDKELGPLPFKATNLGVLDQRKLVDVLNRVHILMCFSLTNISWVPFEGMACGAAVVEADVPSVRTMLPADDACVLAAPNETSLAEAVLDLIDNEARRNRIANAGAQFMAERNWEHTAAQFEDTLVQYCWPRRRTTKLAKEGSFKLSMPVPAANMRGSKLRGMQR